MPHPIRRTAALTLLCAGLLVPAATSHAGPAKGVARAATPVTAHIALGNARAAQQDCENADASPAEAGESAVRAAILCLHNQIRAQHGLPLLKENGRLGKAASGHSSEMVSGGYFDHTTPDGATFVDRILKAGYVKRTDGWTLGENLAWGTGDLSTPAGVMNSWMASPGHKANILKRAYREVGIGIRLGVPSDGTVGATYTTDFGVKL